MFDNCIDEFFSGAIFEPHRKIGNNDVKNITIDTCERHLAGFYFETAIIYEGHAYPCERYIYEEKAKIGHEWWIKELQKAKPGEFTFIYLGDGGYIENEKKTIIIK